MKVTKLIERKDEINLIRLLQDIVDNEAEYTSTTQHNKNSIDIHEYTRTYECHKDESYHVNLKIEEHTVNNNLIITLDINRFYRTDSPEENYLEKVDYIQYPFTDINHVKEVLGIYTVDLLTAILGKKIVYIDKNIVKWENPL